MRCQRLWELIRTSPESPSVRIMPRHSGYEQVTLNRVLLPATDFPQYRYNSFRLLISSLLSVVILPNIYITEVQAQQASDIDWLTWDQLTPEQQALAPELCCGMYVEPELAPFQPLLPNESPESLQIEADQGSVDDSGIMLLEGNVRARQLDAVVEGDTGRYDEQAGIFELNGNIRVREPGILMTGDSAVADNQSGTMALQNASYVLHEQSIRGSAATIIYNDENGVVTIDNGRYSRCEPGNNDWMVQASSIELDRESGRGVARHATLRIRDIPLLYTPWISFPIDDRRATGFLPPSFGRTRDGGPDITLPYYFNLAPNYDATYTARFMSDRGLHNGLELRHLSGWSRNQINLGYLGKDRLYDPLVLDQIAEAENDSSIVLPGDLYSPPAEKRWLLDADHQGRLGERWSTRVDYSAVSDEQYFRDFSSEGIQVSAISFLRRTGQLRYSGDIWQLTTSLQGFQVIDPQVNELRVPMDMLPQITLNGGHTTDFNLRYSLDSQYTYFDRSLDKDDYSQAQINNGLLVRGGRLTTTPTVSYRWATPGIFVAPTLRYYYSTYDLQDQNINQSSAPTRGVFSGSLDAGLIFERPVQLSGAAFTQTLEPRLFYLYNSYEDQSDLPVFDSTDTTFSFSQLFRPNRFSGSDRISDANQMSTTLTTRFLNEAGQEKASASIGQILYFADRRVTLNNNITEEQTRDTSNVAAQLNVNLSDNWRINSYLEWNSSDNTYDVGSFQFQYQSAINKVFNAGFRFRDDNLGVTADGFDRRIIQSDISAAWPINNRWAMVAKQHYDHANDRSLETLAGVEYRNCCWNVRLVYREWIDRFDQQRQFQASNDYGLFLQFELIGLGSIIGGNVGNILAESIYGYRQQ